MTQTGLESEFVRCPKVGTAEYSSDEDDDSDIETLQQG